MRALPVRWSAGQALELPVEFQVARQALVALDGAGDAAAHHLAAAGEGRAVAEGEEGGQE
ncbi:hypothetical protein D3C84_1221850 [compost metagenome]